METPSPDERTGRGFKYDLTTWCYLLRPLQPWQYPRTPDLGRRPGKRQCVSLSFGTRGRWEARTSSQSCSSARSASAGSGIATAETSAKRLRMAVRRRNCIVVCVDESRDVGLDGRWCGKEVWTGVKRADEGRRWERNAQFMDFRRRRAW